MSGAALGVDIEAIQAAVDLNIPFRNQDAKWQPKDQKKYRELLTYAKQVVYVD